MFSLVQRNDKMEGDMLLFVESNFKMKRGISSFRKYDEETEGDKLPLVESNPKVDDRHVTVRRKQPEMKRQPAYRTSALHLISSEGKHTNLRTPDVHDSSLLLLPLIGRSDYYQAGPASAWRTERVVPGGAKGTRCLIIT